VKHISVFKALMILSLALGFTSVANAGEIACSSFERQFNRCPLANANNLNVKLTQKLGGKCKKDHSWGADSDGVWVDKGCSAVFSYSASQHSGGYADKGCPSGLKGNECEYYKDGYTAGANDGKAQHEQLLRSPRRWVRQPFRTLFQARLRGRLAGLPVNGDPGSQDRE
jgi:hypothetical protein